MDRKSLALALFSASVATALTLLWVKQPRDQGEDLHEALRISELEAATAENRARLAGIETSLRDMKRELSSPKQPGPEGAGQPADPLAAFRERLETLERELVSLRETVPGGSRGQTVDIAATLRNTLSEDRSTANGAYQRGEALFQADYGAPMAGEEEMLSTLFQSSGRVANLADLRCRSRICRATYQIANASGLPSSAINAARDAIVDGLSEAYGSAGVHVIHGTDQYGNFVMYIQNRQ